MRRCSALTRRLPTLALLSLTLAVSAVELDVVEVASGLAHPIGVTHAPGSDRLFVLERQSGMVRVLDRNPDDSFDVLPTPFFDVSAYDSDFIGGGERGLLGLAFRPDYATSGVFFINYTRETESGDASSTQTVILRGTVSADPDVANTTAREILVVDQTWSNHNAGWMGFNPEEADHNLYIAFGDGGRGGDPEGTIGHGQATATLLGSMLRIDVGTGFGGGGQPAYGIPAGNPTLVGRDIENDSAPARPEILHFGLRNPWRCSFDRDTGDLWIGDVGQGTQEEISFAANGASGLNFGWRIMEGDNIFDNSNHTPPSDPSLVPAVQILGRGQGTAIIGGYVYRGSDIPGLNGTYIFADYGQRNFFSIVSDGTSVSDFTDITSQLAPSGQRAASFGEDDDGEIYYCDRDNGLIYKIVADATSLVAPTITTTAPVTGTIGDEYFYNVNADGSATITYSLDDSPAGMTINSGSGIIRWTPSASGDFDVTVRAANGTSPDDLQTWTINVAALRPADNPTEPLSGGLDVAAFEGAWNTVPEFSGLTAANAQTTGRPNVVARTRDTDFAQRFSGFLDVPTSGLWTLSFDGAYGVGPILHWPLDEGSGTVANDSSDTHDGTVTDAAWATGRYGGGLDFSNSAGEQVLSTDAGAAINGLDALTVALWVKSNSASSNRGFFSGKEPNGGDDTLSMRYDSVGNAGGGTDLLKFGLTTTTGNYQYESASNTQTTEWQHVVFTWESGGTIEVYLDGVLDTPSNSVAAVINGEIAAVDRVLVGRGSKDSGGSWNGLLDDVRVYPYKVSASDVLNLVGNSHPSSAGTAHAQLWVGDQVVVDTQSSVAASIGLEAGRHRVIIGMTQRVLDTDFAVSWSGPGVTTVRVPNANWDRYTASYGLDPEPRAAPYLNMPTTEAGAIPNLLSATGVFSDVASLTPAAGVVPYAVNTPLWSDAADKRRWIAVPDGETITYQRAGNWDFPVGTVLVKHFAIGSEERPIETRLIVINDSGEYGVTYRWNAGFTDAELLAPAGLTEEITFDGGSTQTWAYPSRAQCASCHTTVAGGVLGVRTRQQNGTLTYGSTGRSDNQLRTWNHLGYFDIDVDQSEIDSALALANLGDGSRSLEDRARSYLDSNCMFCHQPGGPAPSAFDLRFDTPLADQGIIHGSVLNPLGIDGARVVRWGDTARSILYHRLDTTDAAIRMPPIGRTLRDDEAMNVLEQWISTMTAERTIRAATQPGFLWEIDPASSDAEQDAVEARFGDLDAAVDHVLDSTPTGGG